MTLKGRYLLEMQETESASGAAQVLARRLAGDWQLQSAAEESAPGVPGRIAGGAPWRGFCVSSCLCSIRFIGIFPR